MAYDEALAERIRNAIKNMDGVTEKKMFGGIAFMVKGNMCCGVLKDKLMVRVGPKAYKALLDKPHAHEMDFTGRPMKGLLYIDQKGYKDNKYLTFWIKSAIDFTSTLPDK